MDDDLRALGALLAKPGPSSYTVDRGRHQLQQAIIRPASHCGTATGRGRTRWLAAGAGLTAAAAITAALVPGGSHGAATPLSARQILLDAATTAAAGSTTSGTYWHIKVVGVRYDPASTHAVETWRLRDGALWVLDPAGTGVWANENLGGFPISPAGAETTFAQIQRLPESPAALEAWAANTIKPLGYPASSVPGEIAITLSNLIATTPASPAVRAAAFRALALLPNVKSLGQADGGQALLIGWTPFPANKAAGGPVPKGDIKVVIDMATARVRSITTSKDTETIITEGWTNQIPKVVQRPHTFPKK
jgi:hypothetical protein